MKRHLLVIYTLLLYLSTPTIQAQHFNFEHINATNGLSHVTVHSIYQDEIGRMWFATRDGLNCYDGNAIKIYRSDVTDKYALPVPSVNHIIGDRNGHLFLRAQNDFIVFDLRTERFEQVPISDVTAISAGTDCVWICTREALYKYYPKTKQLKSVMTFDSGLNRYYIFSVMEDSKGTLWLCSSGGLFALDKEMKLSNKYTDERIKNIFEDSKKNLWVATIESGLIKILPEGNIKRYKEKSGDKNSLINNDIRALCEDNQGNIWVGSIHGLCTLNPETDRFERYIPNDRSQVSLSAKSVTNLYKDSQGTIWISTYFGGVNYINPDFQPFNYHFPDKNGLSFPVIGKFTQDKRGIVWICTEGAGLCSYDPKTDQFQRFTPEEYGFISANLKEIYYDSQLDCLWLGFPADGICRFDLKTLTTTTFRVRIKDPSILSYKDDLLIGASQGLFLFNKKTGEKTNFLSDNQLEGKIVSQILIDSNHRLWIGTLKGLYRYDLKKRDLELFTHYADQPTSISGNFINTIFEDSDKQIWIATRGCGLNLYVPQTNSFKRIVADKKNLLDNNIVAIAQTPSKMLLLGSSSGLSVMDYENNTFLKYEHYKGFPLTMVNERALFVSPQDDIYVGGVTGMVVFNERAISKRAPKSSNIWFSGLFVNNEQVSPNDSVGVITEGLPYATQVRLRPEHTLFSIQIASDNYVKSNPVVIEYRLKGHDDTWMGYYPERIPTYTNLSPGKYTFEIRIKNNPNTTKSIDIKIIAPLYRTWYAYIIYILLGSLLLYWLYIQARTRMRLRAQVEFEKREKRETEELAQAKLRFFTNISHEFRTPITLILGQADILLKSYNIPPLVYSKILNIHKNARNMTELITELLDFRKQEQGGLKLEISQLDIVHFIEESYAEFNEYAINNTIEFEFIHPDKPIYLWIDTKQMRKVISNLLSNAFKFTPSGGRITIRLDSDDNQVVLCVCDTGAGIKAEHIPLIFDRFYQAQTLDDKQGTGIGLALAQGVVRAHGGEIDVQSEYGQGATFSVTLKRGDTHFDPAISRIETPTEISHYTSQQEYSDFVNEIKSAQCDPEIPLGKLLIVEDNRDLLDMLTEVFSPLYEVETACDGQQGLEKVRQSNPDIIISDIMMPHMSGTELCSILKRNLDTCHIPIILLTAKTSVEHKMEGLRTGADDYITKPFDIRLLIIRCNNLLNSRKLLQQKYVHEPDFSVLQVATTSLDTDLLNRAVAIVTANQTNDAFDIDTFARELGLSRTTLFNKIKSITGLTPNNFIMNIKLKTAAQMLINNQQMNISDIAYYLGFSSPKYFNICFKELFAYSPSEFRSRNSR